MQDDKKQSDAPIFNIPSEMGMLTVEQRKEIAGEESAPAAVREPPILPLEVLGIIPEADKDV